MQRLVTDLGVTLVRTLVSFIVGGGLGFTVALPCGVVRALSSPLQRVASGLMTIPGLALAPLALVLFGFGAPAILAVGIFSAVFPVLYGVLSGFDSVPGELIEAARVDGADRLIILRHVLLPGAAPGIRAGVNISLTKAWRTVIAVEFVAAASRGLGYSLVDYAEYLRFDLVLMVIAVICLTHIVFKMVIDSYAGSLVRKYT